MTALLRVQDLVKHFPITSGFLVRRQVGAVRAVDGISFEVAAGETLGLVGESGCGKSTTARLVLRLMDSTSGTIEFEGQDITSLRGKELRRVRDDLQIIFQDPYASLDPRMTVRQIVAEPLVVWARRRDVGREVDDLLERVGLSREHASRFPHEFSGGQRQRIGIARALALRPKLVICDEPVSALDVSVRAQILNLLSDLQRELGLTFVFISHDLSVVRHICHRVAVMYLGKIVETGTRDQIYAEPSHPYSQALLSAVPIPDPAKQRGRKRVLLRGDIPSPANPPSGCRFRTRCQVFADELTDAERTRCIDDEPALIDRGQGHPSACHYARVTHVV